MDNKVRIMAVLGRSRDLIRAELNWMQMPLGDPDEFEAMQGALQEANDALTEALGKVMAYGQEI